MRCAFAVVPGIRRTRVAPILPQRVEEPDSIALFLGDVRIP